MIKSRAKIPAVNQYGKSIIAFCAVPLFFISYIVLERYNLTETGGKKKYMG